MRITRHVPIDQLIFEHPEVCKKTVRGYVMDFVDGIEVKPVSVVLCVHTGRMYLSNGHHRTYARHILCKPTVLAEVESCFSIYNCKGAFDYDEGPTVKNLFFE